MKLFSFDAETGARNWATTTKSAIYSSPVINDDLIYIASLDRKFYAYEYEEGVPIFRRSIKEMAYSTPTIHGSMIYLGLKSTGILVLDKKNGKKKNTFKLPAAVNASLVIDSKGVLYAGCADGYMYLLDASSGTVLAKYKTGAGIHSTPAITDGTLYVGSKDGSLYALE
jgi:outer membrane protein assembly factor BamB